jgi:ribonuclease HI
VFQLGKTPQNLPFLTNKQILIKKPAYHLRPHQIDFSFSLTDSHTNSNLNIYTDGSKSDDGVGAAFVVYHNKTLLFQNSLKLNPEATVFQAEIQAIHEALTWLESFQNSSPIINQIISHPQNISIFSDSQASLKAITKFKQQNPAVQTIQNKLHLLSSYLNIKLFWVKGHAGCSGNEAADTLAKSATTKQNIDLQLPLAPSFVKNQLRAHLSREWQTLWSNSDRGRVTHTYLPHINHLHLFDSPNINSLLTNHGPFPQYLSRFKIIPSPLCVCGSEGSAEHYMFSCPLTSNLHFKKPQVQFWEEWSLNINNYKPLRHKARSLISWLQENQEHIQHP